MIAVAVALVLANPQVCGPLDSGKIDVSGDQKTVTVEAPEGFLIDRYCVKAGSIQQGNGPKYFDLADPVSTLTFGHPSGKDVSHYSLSYVEVLPTPTFTPEPTPEPTGTPEPSASPTPDPTPEPTGDPTSDPTAPPKPELAPTGGLTPVQSWLLIIAGGLLSYGFAFLWMRKAADR